LFMHLGQETVVSVKDVIGVFDLETCTIGKHTRNFLSRSTKNGNVVNVSMELPKSFVLTGKKDNIKVYISQISSSTLNKRTGYIDDISNI